ncbi:hypothetical protein ACM66B_003262 [Microbotryomycetes sp. NB124-2]
MPGAQASEAERAAVDMDRTVTRDSSAIEALKGEIQDYSAVVDEARDASELEQTMTLREGLRLYPKAIAWSMLLSTAIIMEGYDTTLIGNFFAYPQFNKQFGILQPDGTYNISPQWQAGLQNGVQVGSIIGLALNGWASDRFGYRKTMLASMSMMIAAIFIPFFAKSIGVLLAGAFVQGIPWGVFQTLTTAYASEICPTALRHILTTYVNLCWVIGQFIGAGILRGLLNREDQWGYRIPFAIQWLWPVPILIGTIFAPESPWWLVRKGREEEARRVVRRLTSPKNTSFDADKSVALMVHTNALEKAISEGTTYLDCFRGVDLRRTEIASGAWMIQNLCGSAFMGYSTYFLTKAGMATERAFDMNLGQYAIGFVGTVSSWFLMPYFGRRTLYNAGLAVMFVLLLVIGFLGLAPSNQGAIWAIGGLLLLYTFVYDITVGPVCYCIVAEISSTRLRAKTIVLARLAYNIIGIINSVIMPRFLNEKGLNWGAKTGWFWAGLCALCFVWSYFRLPEAKGRTYGELDVLFEQRVSARKFSKTAVDQFSTSHAVKDKHEVLHKEFS